MSFITRNLPFEECLDIANKQRKAVERFFASESENSEFRPHASFEVSYLRCCGWLEIFQNLGYDRLTDQNRYPTPYKTTGGSSRHGNGYAKYEFTWNPGAERFRLPQTIAYRRDYSLDEPDEQIRVSCDSLGLVRSAEFFESGQQDDVGTLLIHQLFIRLLLGFPIQEAFKEYDELLAYFGCEPAPIVFKEDEYEEDLMDEYYSDRE